MQLFGTITGVVILTVPALPLAGLAVWVLARRRAGEPRPWRRSLAEVGIVYGTVPWLWMILLPNNGPAGREPRVNLVPLRDLIEVLSGSPLAAALQVVGNLLVFAALGFFGPIRFPALASIRRMLVVGAAGSVLVETLQYVLRLDRVSSIDDVLLNTAGAGLAAWASRRWWRETNAAGGREANVAGGPETNAAGPAPAPAIRE
ncbi:VanZ family protein [Actinoplanes couchii]|uniref:VanZ-like domain-containing protein n=1 Tax=Actinoplanes couchii TaxID=403638 RepID=A0ABQ3XTA5_9ACTN|nr:VanZ family protein [Actinoplanes couchii]MDR6317018.1 hypothetical protein [Actinoplanes couchii]GID61735.1 hypothetical protein Aco03nite_101390 [Actinoplanes couchii]